MTSLSEAYTGGGADASVHRRFLGSGLFVTGVSLTVLGTLFGTTDLLSAVGYGLYDARRVAGALAGFGVPALLLGVTTVLPAERRVRALSAVGGVLATLATTWFWTVYPAHWAGYGLDRTLPVTGLYLVGLTLTVVGLFVGVAGFKTRNAPGGTVTLSVLGRGETRTVEVELRGRGSVGLLGRPKRKATRGDGGTAIEPSERPVDAYCGNCRHLEYVRKNDRFHPYCTYHETEMESMDACGSWIGRKEL